jgi:predicted HTH transcriptional regulator
MRKSLSDSSVCLITTGGLHMETDVPFNMDDSQGDPTFRLIPSTLAMMRNFEDHLVERKVSKDEKDWKKTTVAFANSAPVGLPAVLYIGVKDNGEIETPQPNLDEIQRRFNLKMRRVYPRISYVRKIVSENGRQALAVIIPGSELRPHFAGLSYVRRGSESIEASEEQFAELIAQRDSKAAHILHWKDKQVTVINQLPSGYGISESVWSNQRLLRTAINFM